MARLLSLAVVATLALFVTTVSAQAADPAAKAQAGQSKAPAATAQAAPAAAAPATTAPAPRTTTRTYRRYSYDPGYTGNYRLTGRAYANGIRDAASKSVGRYQPWSR